ncbi:transcriptional regulator, AraC family [Geodermatophilus pulveris]|uniref:Transcriptional regulator, AraC family n=1 Tax=Geodermatophilus pulveris TaxID=1564159 RepID=A0A239ICG7_9ACTN|nr:transcriptional regulator, AraC family [Geodermatophilus pulveris]
MPGSAEVFHASFTDHAHPAHTHDGRAHTPGGFRKRVLYLDADTLGEDGIGAAVDRPTLEDPVLRVRLSQLHAALAARTEALEAESRLALVPDRLRRHLTGTVAAAPAVRDDVLTDRLRDLLDARTVEGLGLTEAGRLLGAPPTHLVRCSTRRHGLPPHRHLTGRRLDRARRLLLDGVPAARVAPAVGFYDQAHLTRHLRRLLATTPSAYARSGPAPVSRSVPAGAPAGRAARPRGSSASR